MTDYCRLTMTFRRIDQDKVLRITRMTPDELRGAIDDEKDGRVTIVTDANYGWLEERQKLTKEGVPYYGDHEAGGDYNAAVFASDGVRWADALAVSGLGPVALVHEDGCVAERDVQAAIEYRAVLKAAKAVLGETT